MKAIGVIPARLASTRLSEKVLREIKGYPMIYHVWCRAKQAARLSEVVIACDDERVENAVRNFGGHAVMTRSDHPNGSFRVAEVASRWDADIFVNIQGDEPLIHPDNIDKVVQVFHEDPSVRVATLAVRKTAREEYENPNAVKVVCAANGDALYFSRAPIPHFREGTRQRFSYLKHLGIYGYRKKFLEDFANWKTGILGEAEKLEQIHILEVGVPIRVVETAHDSFGVDTEADLERVRKELDASENGKGRKKTESSEKT